MIDPVRSRFRKLGVLIACTLIPAQILTSLSYIFARKFLNIQLTPLQELEWHFFFALVYLMLGIALIFERHVRIDVIRERLSVKVRAYIEVIGFFIAIVPFSIALIYFGSDFALHSFETGERSRAALGLDHRWIIKSMIPIGGVLLLVSGAIVAHRSIRILQNSQNKYQKPERQ